jgi:hypothetical protein
MQLENILYACAQIFHNFGAVAVVGLPVAALRLEPSAKPAFRQMAWLTMAAWLVQASSGAGFGSISYFVVGELPDIHHVALAALIVKIACAVLALALLCVLLFTKRISQPNIAWHSLAGLGATALTAAALLRWFS